MGPELMELFRKQAEKFGTTFISEDVTSVDLKQRPFKVEAPSGVYEADALIIATGATAKRLQVPEPAIKSFGKKA